MIMENVGMGIINKKVGKISFGVLSPTLIKKMASAKVVTPELYDKEGYPVDGGLMDIRLGVIDPGLRCKTCGGKIKECVGHFGYIALARPVIHIKFVPTVLKMLRTTCRECYRVLLPDVEIKKWLDEMEKALQRGGLEAQREVELAAARKAKAAQKCPHCKAAQQKVSLEKPTTFMENDKRLNPIEVRTRMEKVTDDDCVVLGLNPKSVRPEWLVLTVLPIPPVPMRPSITLESGERSEDDLTHKLGDIVRINQRLFENINAGAPEIIIEDLWDLLQYHVTTFFDNNVAQLPPARHRSGQPLKTLTERIKSKRGRIRHNLAGKRTNFSARTVISPDPMIGLNEVGVPFVIATKLTMPERVTEWNFAYLKAFVERGPKTYPGANYVVRPDGKKKKITDETREQLLEEIQPGFIVERHLMDGDIAIFNRQPSLHRMSMMCHRVRILPYLTFRLNPAVCHPYNADFDGDEMNLHIPQTEEARAEAEILMEVSTQLISPRYGLNVIGCIQDAISGAYILTKHGEFTYQEAVQLLAQVGVTDFKRLSKKETVTGRDIFSALLPADFDFAGTARDGSEVVIKGGRLIKGVMDRQNLGEGSGLMFRNYHKRYGAQMTLDLICSIFRLGVFTLLEAGFSTAISDTDLPQQAKERISQVIDDSDKDVSELIAQYREGRLEPFPGMTSLESVERKILERLNKARNLTGTVVKESATRDTATLVMATAGSRGNFLNLAQMAACVGQQAMRGQRISRGYNGRTLSCFERGDLTPPARGFIRHGFKVGMAPHEFYFGSMTGRDSLMDTALRTPKSGYLYRRLANAMQDLKVEYDGTVRDAGGKIIQFTYGEDGIDVSKSEKGRLDVKKIVTEVVEG